MREAVLSVYHICRNHKRAQRSDGGIRLAAHRGRTDAGGILPVTAGGRDYCIFAPADK